MHFKRQFRLALKCGASYGKGGRYARSLKVRRRRIGNLEREAPQPGTVSIVSRPVSVRCTGQRSAIARNRVVCCSSRVPV